MTEHWHGAQWVLATWFVIMSFLPIMLRIVAEYEGDANRNVPRLTWMGREIARQINRLGLILVLWWGGFWS